MFPTSHFIDRVRVEKKGIRLRKNFDKRMKRLSYMCFVLAVLFSVGGYQVDGVVKGKVERYAESIARALCALYPLQRAVGSADIVGMDFNPSLFGAAGG